MKDDHIHFQALKKAVQGVFLASGISTSSPHIDQWKGQDIVHFQEDLAKKVNGRISEKWFYSYFKNTPDKLPRIDMLNLLSVYAGYTDWESFKKGTKEEIKQAKNSTQKKWGIITLILLLVVGLFIFFPKPKNQFSFCLIDNDRRIAISNTEVYISVLNNSESPISISLDSNGCFQYLTANDQIQFVIKSNYYHNDTVIRSINETANESINLRADDYSLMIKYYSNSNVQDWKNRRKFLHQLFLDDAVIYQVISEDFGIEIYSKQEFIDKLTTPTSSLRNIEILETTYNSNKKIEKLKFRLKN